ncbi:hypothetical protein TELCIR_08856 [Teladorsagia circumcincta]|uniref:Uncharacterized protein n=1 Tax=Teladorsagia circumcincta TaxID=45464 RepID=A0A2G9UGF1_TELCI|nr:hypothetical protein TELCIR_08856 [Teladorsagia circumcincta]
MQPAPVDDANYSKWTICKFHPELLLCKWDPIKKIAIPTVQYQSHTTPAAENSGNVDQADFSAIDLSQATDFIESSSGMKEPLKVKESPILRGAKTDNRPFYPRTNGLIGNREKQAQPPRYDGKLSIENEVDVNYGRKPVASPEVDEFDENILMASDNVCLTEDVAMRCAVVVFVSEASSSASGGGCGGGGGTDDATACAVKNRWFVSPLKGRDEHIQVKQGYWQFDERESWQAVANPYPIQYTHAQALPGKTAVLKILRGQPAHLPFCALMKTSRRAIPTLILA